MFSIFKVNGEKNIIALIISVLLAEGVGFLSGFLSMTASKDYKIFNKPSFSPPGWVFPVVWTILFFLMAVAAYRIWMKGKSGEDVTKALVLYVVQLFLNFLWSIIFFRFRLYAIAFLELLLLLVFILLTTFEFYRIDKPSAYLMIPYIVWVSFAGVLNYAIWMLN
ncbi:tryptophan-rich sensory protein [Clostridium tagluense]|uniref:TspO/MBR family protein n=1 Tax=Clostridium tagluense TaxID=360422 RepID=UPI001C0B5DD3|nr:TspO/MBR family protein [Clostridium tagluense]MBU3129024.1 tryptophan-rich sensory protein [Clostridium tagluense]MCB2311250.1 tryptophan-rich sensory protein [Clostridium tagluense]MCB2316108.1 tryptophan-rich sensory protein [Clostridium tagluense]MCB2320826.1 tryptophan-rich sensory protein [Clostridium tagluense]MCB2325977.1 tryptophan-rich sensory protein [Clostridium tagluense]